MKVLCNCKHEFQDSKYGKQVRIATPVNKSFDNVSKKLREVCCTVCGKSHSKYQES